MRKKKFSLSRHNRVRLLHRPFQDNDNEPLKFETMKKFMLLLTSLFMLSAWTVRADNDRLVAVKELPQKAQQFIGQHFTKAKVRYAKMDRSFLETKYEVVFSDGSKAEFLKNGEWKEVSCPHSAVPAGILPGKIARKVEELYPDVRVIEIERDSREYDVKFSDGTELTFDDKFELIDIDD